MFQIEIDRYLIRLRFARPARFHFNHGGALMGLMCRAMQTHHLPAGFIPFACESGRVRFGKGDMYHVGLTVAGAARDEFNPDLFGSELSKVGLRVPAYDKPRATLAGNFEVESIEKLPPPDVSGELLKLKGAGQLTLKFLSPFRLERPPVLKGERTGYLSRGCFPPEHFIQRLAKRLFLLTHGRYPEREECDEIASHLEPSEDVGTESSSLVWLDVPLEGSPGKHERQPKGYTLGGVLGRVAFTGVPESWVEALVLGQHLHAGGNSHFGLGRYVIEETDTRSGDPFRPARTLAEELYDPCLLEESLRHVARYSTAKGLDGIAPKDYLRVPDMLAAQVAAELKYGTYRPAPLLGLGAVDNSRLSISTVPTARDRMVQSAACAVIGNSIETLLEDCSFTYRKGFSRANAAHAFKRAYEDGYRYIVSTGLEPLLGSVSWERLFLNLDALFPGEPLVQLLKGWVTAPVVVNGSMLQREGGLPAGAAISPLLAKLYLDEFKEELLGRTYRLVWYGRGLVMLGKYTDADGVTSEGEFGAAADADAESEKGEINSSPAEGALLSR